MEGHIGHGCVARATLPEVGSWSERKADRKDPAMVVLMKCRYRDLCSDAKSHMESPSHWKCPQHKSRSHEHLLLSIQGSVQPEGRILLEHGPYLSLDPIINLGVEEERPAQNTGAAGRESCSDRALNVPGTKALGCREGR